MHRQEVNHHVGPAARGHLHVGGLWRWSLSTNPAPSTSAMDVGTTPSLRPAVPTLVVPGLLLAAVG